MSNIDFTYFSEILEYNQESGLFFWKKRVNSKVDAGMQAGNVMSSGYIHITVKGKKILAHRLAWLFCTKSWPKGQIDHINGDKLDNRISNLRDVCASINLQNRRKPAGNNPYVGVSRIKGTNLWQAHIGFDGLQKNLGRFKSAEEARDAYLFAKKKYHPTAPH